MSIVEIEKLAGRVLGALPAGQKVSRRRLKELVAAALTVAARNALADARAAVHEHDQKLRLEISTARLSQKRQDAMTQLLDRQRDRLAQLTFVLSAGPLPAHRGDHHSEAP